MKKKHLLFIAFCVITASYKQKTLMIINDLDGCCMVFDTKN